MNKREQREEQRRLDEERRKKQIARNWIIGAVSLIIAALCYGFNDQIAGFFTR
ncbi:MAG: hypothetical protein LBC82_09865 [Oscillospiraceae bacterium]|nr:hypothetical protein [Oscillospiraceae bacterium]